MIDIVEEQIQRAHPLHQSRLEPRPLVGGNDSRHEIEWNQSFGTRLLAIDGERDADAMEDALRFATLLRDAVRRRPLEPVGERAIVGTQRTFRGTHFVEGEG